jgi:HEAT repeat protein
MKNLLSIKKKNSTITALILTATALLVTACSPTTQHPYHWPQPSNASELLSQANEIIEQSLVDSDPLIRVNAIEAVALTKQVTLMPKVRKMLASQFFTTRFAAALAVGDTGYTFAQPQVQKLLKDQNPNVRIAAAYAMYKLGQQQYFDVLRNAMASKDLVVRANAVMLVGKTAHKDASKLLYAAITMEDSDDKVRYQAVESIASLKDEYIEPRIWAMLISVYPDVRVIGIRAMAALGTTKSHGAVIGMLDDNIVEVRLAAAEQLGILHDPAGELAVLDVFRKNLTAKIPPRDKERVYIFTARAIGRICTPKLTDFLPQLLKYPSKQVRLQAAIAVFYCSQPPKNPI